MPNLSPLGPPASPSPPLREPRREMLPPGVFLRSGMFMRGWMVCGRQGRREARGVVCHPTMKQKRSATRCLSARKIDHFVSCGETTNSTSMPAFRSWMACDVSGRKSAPIATDPFYIATHPSTATRSQFSPQHNHGAALPARPPPTHLDLPASSPGQRLQADRPAAASSRGFSPASVSFLGWRSPRA